ncbi:MAG: signal transduction protein, partial [Desulfuromonas sp.]
MAQENIFFLPIRDVCQRDVVTCPPSMPLVDAARIMRERNITSVVVSEHDAPIGIVTDRDLRNKVVAPGIDPGSLLVSDIMNAPLIMVREDDFVFEALYRMSRYRIHRVVVIDEQARLCGIISNSDVLRLQTRSPQQMLYEIEEAQNLADLKKLHQQVQNLVLHLLGTGVRTSNMVRLISHLNDRILVRLINQLRADRYADLPDRFSFVVLGSEGRNEQTLTTDQDNAIIYADTLSAEEIKAIEAFAQELIDSLIAIGVPPCPGGIMAKNDFWRRSLGSWQETIDHWLADSSPKNILNGSMFFDIRTLHGDATLEAAL